MASRGPIQLRILWADPQILVEILKIEFMFVCVLFAWQLCVHMRRACLQLLLGLASKSHNNGECCHIESHSLTFVEQLRRLVQIGSFIPI